MALTTALNYQRPFLYAKQAAFVDCRARYPIVEACTKTGKTVGCLVAQAEDCMFRGGIGRNYWWVAPVAPQARIAFTRLKQWIHRSGLPIDAFRFREQEQSVVWPNGAKQWFKSAEKPDNLYGEDVAGAIIDEATRVREESWHAVRSTVTATRGQVRIIGNVRGSRNWAYRMARRAEAGAADMAYFKIIAWDAVDAGILDRAEIEDAQDKLPKHVFEQLYLCIASDEGNPFGLEAIQECIMPDIGPGPAQVYGFDLAKKHDYVAGVGLNAAGQVCYLDRWHANWRVTKERIRDIIGDIPTLIDQTGVGDPIVEELADECSNVTGYLFTLQSKQHLMEALSSAIDHRRVGVPQSWLTAELQNFEYEYTRLGVRYTAPEGEHDDGVCALALANWLFVNRPPEAKVYSLDDRHNGRRDNVNRALEVSQSDFSGLWR